MKKKSIMLISSILAMALLCPTFASCTPQASTEESSSSETQGSESESSSGGSYIEGSGAESSSATSGEQSGSDSESKEQSSNNSESSESEGSESETTGNGNGNSGGNESSSAEAFNNQALIEYANSIKNGVNYYYPTAKRESAVLENLEMILEYGLLQSGNKQVTSLTNKNGGVYLENSMDVFVRMNSGNTYYASTSKTSTTSNLFRLGYYFYEARYEGQDFLNSAKIKYTKNIDLSQGCAKTNNVTYTVSNGEINATLVSTSDPYLVLKDDNFTNKDGFTFLEFSIKADSSIRAAQVYFNTGSGFNADQTYKLSLVADGNYHTYTIPLPLISGFNGGIKALRFDLDSTVVGSSYSIKDAKLMVAETSDLPVGLSIARSFNAYSDKLHHVLQVSAVTATSNVKEIGMITKIDANKVTAVIVKDSKGSHSSINGVDWASAEYVGFNVTGAGIFGYILPADNASGSIKVTLENGYYVIEQTKAVENGTISPSVEGTNNANDFYMGQRIYTDSNNDFAEFVYEAECERHPIANKFFKLTSDSSPNTAYVGYDALRGIYVFSYGYTAISSNDYPTVKFSIRSSDYDRKIYVMAYNPGSTVVETSVLINNSDMLIPVPVEVGKNFSEAAGERNLYNIDDPTYSESIVPLVLKKDTVYRYGIVNAYYKWGNFPLKQVSWIQFRAPYYHLSTAMTETNCITPYYTTRTSRDLNTLPDFRAMSAPPFSGEQRNSGGTHHFLKYTDANGNFITSENTLNVIGSYGPTYADVTMDYITEDGKIKVTYNHMEMPQEDENRTYYEMTYEILEDVSFNDFAKDFSFYSVRSNDPKGVYTLLGYLDENDQSKVVNAKMAGDDAVYYTLGKDVPYFSYMKMTEDRGNGTGYVNLAFIVHSSSFIIGGQPVKPNFKLADLGGTLSLSLDYGALTLKKGDKITINAILMPWGSQETIYDGSNGKAPDQNVLDVRQNSVKNPLRAEAVKDCEVIDTVYVPMLKTTNGKTAEFTIKGGNDNCAIRIYGFNKLTVPKVYELIDGEWVYLKLSSAYYSYNQDAVRMYDGYMVYYDEDGTFSYSFVAEMKNGEARTFKISCENDFGSWGSIDNSDIISNAVQDENINIIVKGESLFNAADGAVGFGRVEYLESENAVRFYADPNKDAAYFYAFQANIFETGDYFVIKYRAAKNGGAPSTFKFYTSTFEKGATYDNHHWSTGTLIRDDEWHVLVIDISEYEKLKKDKFENADEPREYYNTFPESEDDGLYYATFLRLDIFNQILSENVYIDIQYLGFSNDLEKIKTYNNDLYEIQFSSTAANKYELIPTGGSTPPSGGDDTDNTEGSTTESEKVETEATTETTASEVTEPETEPEEDGMKIEVGGEALYNLTQTTQGSLVNMTTQYMDGYTRFTVVSGKTNGYFNVFNRNEAESGKYLVIKYRLPKNNASTVSTIKFFISTTQGGTAATNNFYSSGVLISDDKWHVFVIDLEKYEAERDKTNEFLPSEVDGKYYPKFLQLYLFADTAFNDGTYIDVEYVGMCANFNTVKLRNTDIGTIELSKTNLTTPKYQKITNEYRYLDPTSGYTLADKYFCFHGEKINGTSVNYNSVSNKGITEFNLNETLTGTTLTVGGWCPVEGGTSKYMWSIDGKTWYQCPGTPTDTTSVLSAASGQMSGAYTFNEADGVGGRFNLSIDLSDYKGQTVDVRIASIPVGSTNSLAVLTVINNVTVSQ